MIRILFCDDDPAFVSSFLPAVKRQAQSVLELKDDELCCTYFQKGRELLDHLEKNEADLLFLDIDMPEMSGFELARALKSGKKKPTLVFVSAYDNFVYSAFEFSPFAYLRKERISEELPPLFFRIREQISNANRQLILKTAPIALSVKVEEVLYFESAQNYYKVHMTDGTVHSCRGTLSGIEKELAALDFFRIHSAYAVNLLHVKPSDEKGFLKVGSESLPLAQKRAADFKKALSIYTRRRLGL